MIPPAKSREMLATIAILGALGAFVAARPLARRFAARPTAERCAELIARWTELEARSRERVPAEVQVDPASRDAMRCARELTKDEVECAMKAGYVDEIERCMP